jgi:topoisomerase-4 subunit A
LEATPNVQSFFANENPKSFIEFVTTEVGAIAEIVFPKIKDKQKEPETVDLDEFITVKGIKAIGNQLTKDKVKSINITIPEPPEVIEEEIEEKQEVDLDDEGGTIGSLFDEEEN